MEVVGDAGDGNAQQELVDANARREPWRKKRLMRPVYIMPKWPMAEAPLTAFLDRVEEAGFDGIQMHLPGPDAPGDLVRELQVRQRLRLVATIATSGKNVGEHLSSLERSFRVATECQPELVSGQIGRDIFTFDDNVRIFERGLELAQAHGVPLLFETHRQRPTYSAIDTPHYLKRLPGMRLTADFSHWMVVHESDLSDQEPSLELAISRSHFIHARVGYDEGPQVPHPNAPERKRELVRHLQLWQRIVDTRAKEGAEELLIAPEFGPPPYMQTLPFTRAVLADPWTVNVEMKRLLETGLKFPGTSTS